MSATEEENSFVERVLETVGIREDDEEYDTTGLREDTVSDKLVPPTNRGVIEEALDSLIKKRQEEKARDRLQQAGVDTVDTESIEVTLELSDPEDIIEESTRKLADIRDKLIEELDRIVALQENSVGGADIDTMLYVVDRNAGAVGNYTVVGGGESLVWNLGNKNGWTKDEIDFIIECHRVAGQKNGLGRHLLLDSVVIIPNKVIPEDNA